MKNIPCPKCGLIQPFDVLMGYMVCSTPGAEMIGCPKKEIVFALHPNWKYKEELSE
jgi:hypothetical protein